MALNQEDADRRRERWGAILLFILWRNITQESSPPNLFVSIGDCQWSWQYKLRHNAPGEEW